MKKIILGMITITLAIIIAGCGKAQQASGGGGGGNSPSKFIVSGTVQAPNDLSNVQASLPRRFGRALASLFVSRAYAVNSAVSGAPVKAYIFGTQNQAGNTVTTDGSGEYSLELPADNIYELVVQYTATGGENVTLKNLTHKDAPATANITPVSTLTAELIKAKKDDDAVKKSFNNSEALNTLLTAVQDIAETKASEAEALIQATGNARDTQVNNVKSAVDTMIDNSAKAANAVTEFYELPKASITIDGDLNDWVNVPIVWRNVKNEWGSDEVSPREGGLLGSIRYAISNDKTKLYYLLALKDGEYFAADGQYGLTIATREIGNEGNADKTKAVRVALQGRNDNSGFDFYAARADAVDGHWDADKIVTANHGKSSTSTGILEVEIDINSLELVFSASPAQPSDFATGRYQVQLASSLPIDNGAYDDEGITHYNYISRSPVLMLDLN
jgi:hypothetical protein